jgi:transaldolase
MKSLQDLKVKIFADGAEKSGMLEMYGNPLISGFTTNPTLMRKAGIVDYESFAREILSLIPDRPISFEVFADEFDQMESQARIIARWGSNVYVKIPITNTKGKASAELVHRLSRDGIQINVTALTTLEQVEYIAQALRGGAQSNISVFAGRIADTGVDPLPLMTSAVDMIRDNPEIELIWASPRELLNIFHADAIGCHIITVTNDILKKLPLVGKDLAAYSLDTVKMFFNDASASRFSIVS